MEFSKELKKLLNGVPVLTRRLELDQVRRDASISMLRGTWGRALRLLSPDAYSAVFDNEHPGYILCPPRNRQGGAVVVEWTLLGPAVEYDGVLLRAWDMASGMGLGTERRPFVVRSRKALDSHEKPFPAGNARLVWRLGTAGWPIGGVKRSGPCRLSFSHPLRILRNKRLMEKPMLADISLSILRRAGAFSSISLSGELKHEVLRIAEKTSATKWEGKRLDFVRYSSSQKNEITQRGVAGYLDLPEGPGSLWPLLAAGQWLHAGKGTVMGLGQMIVEPL